MKGQTAQDFFFLKLILTCYFHTLSSAITKPLDSLWLRIGTLEVNYIYIYIYAIYNWMFNIFW